MTLGTWFFAGRNNDGRANYFIGNVRGDKW